MKAFIVSCSNGLQATLQDGRRITSADPLELADSLFSLGVRSGNVSFPDWRELDIAPHSGIKIAFHARLKQLENEENR